MRFNFDHSQFSATTKETIELKFEVNCDSDKPEIVQIHEGPTHRQMDFQNDQIVSLSLSLNLY